MPHQLKNPIPLPIECLAPPPELFTHESQLHGQPHVARVILHTFLLLDVLGFEALSAAAWAAAYIHDIARTHDGACRNHGRNAMQKVATLPHVKSLLANGGVTAEDWKGISIAVENHCREEVSKTHPYWTLTAILKDADALDRVRLGDLDNRFFRFPESNGLVPVAKALYEETHEKLQPGSDYFAALWPVAQRLLSGSPSP